MRNIDFLVNNGELNYACFCKTAEMRGKLDCENVCCDDCVTKTVEWLLEDRIIDWSRVKTLTPVKVRDYKDEEWKYEYYFIDERYADGKHYFIASNTKDPKDPGFDFAIFNECDLT